MCKEDVCDGLPVFFPSPAMHFKATPLALRLNRVGGLDPPSPFSSEPKSHLGNVSLPCKASQPFTFTFWPSLNVINAPL